MNTMNKDDDGDEGATTTATTDGRTADEDHGTDGRTEDDNDVGTDERGENAVDDATDRGRRRRNGRISCLYLYTYI